MNRLVRCVAVVLVALLAQACSSDPPPPPPDPPRNRPTLRIGLIPEHNIFSQLDRYRPLSAYLSRTADVDIEIEILPRYGNIIENFTLARMDGAFFGSFTFALAHERVGVVPVARPVGLTGTSTYHGMIFVRKDSGITTIDDMKGKRFVFVDEATTAGYLLPLDYFITHGVKDFRGYLSEYYFAGTHEGALYDVLEGKADIGAAKNTVYERLVAAEPSFGTDLTVLARSPEVPENGLAVMRSVDPAIRSRLENALLSMQDSEDGQRVLREFGVLRFVKTTREDYEPVFRYATEIGLELASYEYQND